MKRIGDGSRSGSGAEGVTLSYDRKTTYVSLENPARLGSGIRLQSNPQQPSSRPTYAQPSLALSMPYLYCACLIWYICCAAYTMFKRKPLLIASNAYPGPHPIAWSTPSLATPTRQHHHRSIWTFSGILDQPPLISNDFRFLPLMQVAQPYVIQSVLSYPMCTV